MRKIDKKSFEPVYSQLVNILSEQIESGKYPPGSWLPSESKLKGIYEVSSVTIRRAIRILVEKGIVETTRGKGTVVKALDLDSVSFDLTNIQDIFKDPHANQVKLLHTKIMPACETVAKKLKLNPGERVIHLKRMIIRHGVPLIYHHQYLRYDPKQPVVEAELSLTSLRGLLECSGKGAFKNCKGGINKGEIKLKVAALNKDEAAYFKTEQGTPTFHLEHLFFDSKNEPTSWGYFLFFNDKLGFAARVGMWCNP